MRILPADIQRARQGGFAATSDYGRIAEMDAIIICVPTPLNEYREPDMSYIVNTVESVAPHLRAGQLVVLESTTYPGTTEEVVIPILEHKDRAGLKAARAGADSGNVFYIAFSPEREDPGRTDIERHDIPKVIGGLESKAGDLAAVLYGSIFRRTVRVSTPAIVTDHSDYDYQRIVNEAQLVVDSRNARGASYRTESCSADRVWCAEL